MRAFISAAINAVCLTTAPVGTARREGQYCRLEKIKSQCLPQTCTTLGLEHEKL